VNDQPSKHFLSGEVSTRYVLALAMVMGGWSNASDGRLSDRIASLETSDTKRAEQMHMLLGRHDREGDQQITGVRRELDSLGARTSALESRLERRP
jgi:hypothetical protein